MNYEKLDKDQLLNIIKELKNEIEEKESQLNEYKIYKMLFDTAPDALFVTETDSGKIVKANPKASELLGKPIGKIIGSHQSELHPEKYLNESKEAFKTHIKDIENQGKMTNMEFVIANSDNEEIPVEIASNIAVFNGVKYLIGFFRDISEKKKTENYIKEMRQIFKMFMENLPASVYIKDKDDKIVFSNSVFSELFGDVHSEPDLENIAKSETDLSDLGTDQFSFEEEIVDQNNNKRVFQTLRFPIEQPNKEILTGNISLDITEMKNTESELYKAQAMLIEALEQNPAGIVIAEAPRFNLKIVNKSAADIMGDTISNMKKISVDNPPLHWKVLDKYRRFISPEDYPLIRAITHGEITTNREMIIVQSNGDERWVLLNASPIFNEDGDTIASIIVFLDITDSKRAEEALRKSEQKFRVLYNNLRDGNITCDMKGNIIDVNPAVEKMLGYSREELLKMNFYDITPKEWYSYEEHYISQILKRGYSDLYEKEYIRKDGTLLPIELQAYLIKDENGSNAGMWGLVRDISERKKAKSELYAEKERLRVTLESIGDGVIAADTSGKIIIMNKIAEDLTGWSKRAAYRKPLSTVLKIRNRNLYEIKDNLVKKIIESNSVIELYDYAVLESEKGCHINITVSGSVIKNAESSLIGVVIVFKDISEKMKIEEEMRKMQKLESIGVLAGGIAHDFNNILTAILGNLSIAKLKINRDSGIFKILSEAENASMRARNLTQQLLTFAKGGAPIKQSADIAEIIEESSSFVLRGSNVSIFYKFPDNLWNCEIDKGQISQVIENLIINADQAMPDGGLIVISGENIDLDEDNFYSLKPGSYVKISIKDNGTGIPRKFLSKIFDPYFTTKQKGNGLGLSIVYSIIKKHGGHIYVESVLQEGTEFLIYLPAIFKKDLLTEKSESETHKGNARILVMDDEEIIRNVLGAMLEHFGHNTDFAPEGKKAVKMYRDELDKGSPYDLVIMDLTIPGGMGGKEACEKILEIHSEAVIVASSGYSNNPVMSEFHKYGFKESISKPYKINDLGKLLNSLLK